ncbi:hypothetical protein LCGC14_2539250 [marine sediment metagenome]|uniref:HNH nuclease domain-containing protein n=1 Tax=marine sediment metagenome TaxID=412755 RepID=A0A0F9D2Q6_9ZZZZ
MKTKKCSGCKKTKQYKNFNKNKNSFDGLQQYCRDCQKEYRLNNKERYNESAKKWYRKNTKYCLELKKKWVEQNQERTKQNRASWYKNNRDKSLLSSKKWRENNPEKVKDNSKSWNNKNKEYISQKDKERYNNNKEYFSNKNKKWCKENPEKARERGKRRRAKKKNINENYTITDEQITLKEFNYKCYNCESNNKLEIDHHLCLNDGYPLTLQNAVILCKPCNSSKGSKSPNNFYSKIKLQILQNKLQKISTKYAKNCI